MDTMLYFPLSSLPREVAGYAGLYWDHVITIAPPNYDPANAWTQALREAGVLTFVEPSGLDLDEATIVDDLEMLLTRRPALVRVYMPVTAETRLYRGKLPLRIEEALRDRRAALEVDRNTFVVSSEILPSVIAIVAREVAEKMKALRPGHRVSLFANRASFYDQALAGVGRSSAPSWRTDLGDFLPCPGPSVEMDKILYYRRKYGDERLRLAAAIERIAAMLATPQEEASAAAVWQELEKASHDVGRSLASLAIPIVMRGLFVGFAVGTPVLTGAPLSLSISAAATAIGVGLATRSVRRRTPGEFDFLSRARRLQRVAAR